MFLPILFYVNSTLTWDCDAWENRRVVAYDYERLGIRILYGDPACMRYFFNIVFGLQSLL